MILCGSIPCSYSVRTYINTVHPHENHDNVLGVILIGYPVAQTRVIYVEGPSTLPATLASSAFRVVLLLLGRVRLLIDKIQGFRTPDSGCAISHYTYSMIPGISVTNEWSEM